MKEIESEEPILAAWRYHEGESPPAGWHYLLSDLRWIARRLANRFRHRLASPRGRVVLFPMGNTPATVGTIRPLVRALRERGASQLIITKRTTAFLTGEERDVSIVTLQELLSVRPSIGFGILRDKARRHACSLAERLPDVDGHRAERWIFDGLIAREAATTWLRGAKALVLDSDIAGYQKGLILGAKSIGVPTFVIQHGFFGEHQFPTTADYLLTWGDYFSRIARDRFGVPEERLIAGGCPRWDHLPALRKKPRDAGIRERLGGVTGKPLVLILSNAHSARGYPEHYGPFFQSVKKLVEAEIPVALKLHPSEGGMEPYCRSLGEDPARRLTVVPPDIDLYTALRHCDVAFQVFTAAVLEAMLLGVPVLYEAGGNDSGKLTDIPDHGGGKWTREDDIVADVLILGSRGEERMAMLERQDAFLREGFAHCGRSAEFLANLILRVKDRVS